MKTLVSQIVSLTRSMKMRRLISVYVRQQIETNGLAVMNPIYAFELNREHWGSVDKAINTFCDRDAVAAALKGMDVELLIYKPAGVEEIPFVCKRFGTPQHALDHSAQHLRRLLKNLQMRKANGNSTSNNN